MRTAILIALLFLTGASPALAAPEAYTAQVLPSASKPIEIQIQKGKLIRLPRPANTIFIAQPTIADINVQSNRLVYLLGLAPGETTLYALDENEQIVVAQRVVVAPNIDRIRELFGRLRPNTPVEVKSVGNRILMTGTVSSADIAEEFARVAEAAVGSAALVINRIRVVEPTQVNLRVKFAEVSRDINKKIGFNWEAIGNISSRFFLGAAIGTDIDIDDTGTILLPDDPQDRIIAGYNYNQFSGTTILELLDDEGLITVLAEPNLTAMSGETATFLAGGEFPIPVSAGNGATAIEFRQFGVGLSFTPTILGNSRINLKVIPEVSQLTSAGSLQANGFNIPALSTRKADTTVEVGSGQSFVLAGLLQNTTNQDLSDIPGLKELPIIGALFRSDAFRRRETELMIVVTPYIVRPTVARIPLPTDNYMPPKDLERFFLGENHVRQPPNERSAPLDPQGRPGLVGPAGFVLQ
jgi:pilus assembly protein CpaC